MWSVEEPSEQEEIQKEGLCESISTIVEIIQQEAKLVPPSRIFLGVTWKEYEDGGHWIYEPEDKKIRNGVDDIEEFIGLCTQDVVNKIQSSLAYIWSQCALVMTYKGVFNIQTCCMSSSA